MFRLSAICLMGLATLTACRSDDNGGGNVPPVDLAAGNTDTDGGGGGGDMSTVGYNTAAIHDIDTNAGGVLGSGKKVKLTGVVITTPSDGFATNTKTMCAFEAYVQDPACTTPPCGIVAQIKNQPIQSGMKCYVDQSTGYFKTSHIGDVVDITGTVDTFPDSMNSAIVQHSITINTISTSATTATITPKILTTGFAFVTHMGTDWITYEGTIVKLAPTGGIHIVSVDTAAPYQIHATYNSGANAILFGTDYYYTYTPYDADGGAGDGGTDNFPVAGTTYSSITVNVNPIFGGVIDPRITADFAP